MVIPTSRIRDTGNVTKFCTIATPGERLEIGDPYRLAPGIKTGVKYSPHQQHQLKRLLTSPHRAKVLRMRGITAENEINIPFKARDSFSLMSSRTSPYTGLSMALPHTALSRGAPGGRVEVPLERNHSLHHKELPPKPILRQNDSPERRAVFDATESLSTRLDDAYPALEPNNTKSLVVPFATPLSDNGSFAMASSLCTLSDGGSSGIQTGIAKKFGLLEVYEQPALSTRPKSTSDYTLPAPRRTDSRIPKLGHVASHTSGSPMPRKKADSVDFRSRSTNAKRRTGYLVSPAKSDKELPQAPKEDIASSADAIVSEPDELVDMANNLYMGGALPAPPGSPVSNQADTPLRRSHKFGVGPTVRFSKDAHSVIMGTGSLSKKKQSNLKKAQELKPESKTQSGIGNINKEQTSLYVAIAKSTKLSNGIIGSGRSQSSKNSTPHTHQDRGSPHPVRSSSLIGSPEHFRFPEPPPPPVEPNSLAARLSRPTRASQARAADSRTNKNLAASDQSYSQAKKAKMTPRTPSTSSSHIGKIGVPVHKSTSTTSIKRVTKEFKTRLSSIIPGFRRNTSSQIAIKFSSNARIDEENTVDNDSLALHANRRAASRNLTTYNNSGMDRSPLEIVSSYPSSDIFEGATSTGDGSQVEVAGHSASQPHAQSPRSAYLANSRRRREPGGAVRDDNPPTPPRSSDGPTGHNTEALQPGQRKEVNWADENGVGAHLDSLLDTAECHFQEAFAATDLTSDPVAIRAIGVVLEQLASAIMAVRNARISTIALQNANAGLARFVAQLSNSSGEIALAATQQPPNSNESSEA